MNKPRCPPGPNCGSLVREGISEGGRPASQVANASTVVSSASGRTASATPSSSRRNERARGDRARLATARRARTGPRVGLRLGRAPLGQNRSPSKEPRSPRRAGPSPWPSRRSASSGKLREKVAGPRGDNGPRDDKATPVLHLDAPKPRRVIPPKAEIQSWDTTKRRHKPRGRRERRKSASLIASYPGCSRTRA